MSKIIGIDLGTTNSCVAVMEGGGVKVLTNSEGSRTTPSVVAFTDNGERLVGQIAKRQAITNCRNTIHAVKRLIGRKFEDTQTQRDLCKLPYDVSASSGGLAQVEVLGRGYSPAEISSMVLAKMKRTAEDYLDQEVGEAVITVPAYFNDAQRQATRDAGRIAGLKVRRIINEPTAAALAYGLERSKQARVVVFDLGGGTFDISILDLAEGVYEVKATAGDTHLGGEDFDHQVVDWMVAEFAAANGGLDLSADPMALQRLKEAAEKAKMELSEAKQTQINLPFITANQSGPLHLNLNLTRSKLEGLVERLVKRLEAPCVQAMRDAGMTAADIDEVILVGGMTRMPRVQQKVGEIFGNKPHKGVNPDEVVAVGAAIQAAVLGGEMDDVRLLDVTPLSLGIETLGGVMTRLIERNTAIPTFKSQIFSTATDNQPAVSVHVLQGERKMVTDNMTLGKFELSGIPPAPRGVPQIEVNFNIDADGLVHVSAKDLDTGREHSIQVRASSGLSEQEIQRLIAEAHQHELADEKRARLAELCNQADGLLQQVDQALADAQDQLAQELLVQPALKLRDAYALKAVEPIAQALGALDGAWEVWLERRGKIGATVVTTQGMEYLEAEFEEVPS